MTYYEGPCKIDCPIQCDVPKGAELFVIPGTRHKWTDVIICPNKWCGLCFLIIKRSSTSD